MHRPCIFLCTGKGAGKVEELQGFLLASNLHVIAQVPLVASNRIGREEGITFYGGSFICDNKGAILQQVSVLVLSALRACFLRCCGFSAQPHIFYTTIGLSFCCWDVMHVMHCHAFKGMEGMGSCFLRGVQY